MIAEPSAVSVRPCVPADEAGIATCLMRTLEPALVELGCPKLNLQVRATNAAVIGFYQSLGFALEERASLGKRL